jgi:hypothetical protein
MKNAIIHSITYLFILIVCYEINILTSNVELVISITFTLGWFTYPLIKYLQDER